MIDLCCCPSTAGNTVCELPPEEFERPSRPTNICPECGQTGKPVQGQTVKALLAVSLREVQNVAYLFYKTQTCSVVYFSLDGEQTFSTPQIRERVYQKEPGEAEVFVCYCFRHTVGDLKAASPEARIAIVADITLGIQAGQCACELRNPQGSCCLGNVYALIKRLEQPILAVAD